MGLIEKTYVVWFWNGKERSHKIGKPFVCKQEAEDFADSLRHWEYITIVYSYKH